MSTNVQNQTIMQGQQIQGQQMIPNQSHNQQQQGFMMPQSQGLMSQPQSQGYMDQPQSQGYMAQPQGFMAQPQSQGLMAQPKMQPQKIQSNPGQVNKVTIQ